MGSKLLENASPATSATEIFEEHFPEYLAIGMSSEQYWDGDCQLAKYYREADKIKVNRRNQELWLQGAYIYEALLDVSPILHAFAKNGTKPHPYAKEPYPITLSKKELEQRKEDEQKANRQKAMAVFQAWADGFDDRQKKKEESAAEHQ